MNLNVSGNTTINSVSTFNLTCEKNINLSSMVIFILQILILEVMEQKNNEH